MAKIEYVSRAFSQASLSIIETAEQICSEYAAEGYDLTLRQLYYQFVARGLIENSDREYKRLGGIVNDARLAGLIDWNHITDRTRNLRSLATWNDPSNIVRACAQQFRIDKWDCQRRRVEVWVEKEALAGVVQRPAERHCVPWFCCRGYVSQSEMWEASQRLGEHMKVGQSVVIIHLGDHDPSGIDMTRDIVDRLAVFLGQEVLEGVIPPGGFPAVAVCRVALNIEQIRRLNPPPNPAKVTDSRARSYIRRFGDKSWELDALDPATVDQLIDRAILDCRDETLWEAACARERVHRQKLDAVAQQLGRETA